MTSLRNVVPAWAALAVATAAATASASVTTTGTTATAATAATAAPAAPAAALDWLPVRPADGAAFDIARTETTIGQFRRFAAATGRVTRAERAGGGEVYEAGWTRKPGWTWQRPFGVATASDDEPAVHLDWDEAQAFCRWAGGRLPTDREWVAAAYTETRDAPAAPFVKGRTYAFPTGDSPAGAQCLGDCGDAAAARAVRHGAALSRGTGHARAGSTPAGVNGLHEMAANAWEWVDEPAGATAAGVERRTRGGSWWYGASAMLAGHLQSKPPATAVVYIGFRCARPR